MDPSKVTALRESVRTLESAVVAFSGGLDSTLVARIARDELDGRSIAVTGVSPSLPARELEEARDLARVIGIAHTTIESREIDDPRYLENTPERCYWCKHELYNLLETYSRAHGFAAILDGTNVDDLGDVRPGRRAAAERGVRSPLLDAGFTKADVRALARDLGLPNWDKPAAACLSSRIPHGTPVTIRALGQIERAEAFLRDLGIGQLRVRHHGDVARVEVDPTELSIVIEHRDEIVAALRALGFGHVALDLAGYRQGGSGRPPERS